MPTFLLTLTASERVASAIADELSDGTRMMADAAGAFDLGDGSWGLEAYFAEEPDPERLADVLTDALATRDDISTHDLLGALAGLMLRRLDEDDFSGFGLDTLPPIVAGRFRVFGEHNAPTPADRRRNDLVVEASTAFGTGDHASTLLALTALDRILTRCRPARILDVGCGTGILALAAAKVVPSARIVASDIEPVAVRMSDLNRRGNGIGGNLVVTLADGLGHPTVRGGAPYDLVLANILPGPLCRLASAIVAVMRSGAPLVVAGLRRGEEARLVSAYGGRGLVLQRRLRAKEWSSLVFVTP